MIKINLFGFDNHIIDTSKFDHLLHGKAVTDFEKQVCKYVGAKYAASFHSASYAMYCVMKSKACNVSDTIRIPSMIPPVVPNVLRDAGKNILLYDDIDWVGDSYVLTENVIDSAQKINRNQYKKECDDDDIMIFSLYPTKPLSSLDGGVIVSNNKDKIDDLKSLAFYGMDYSDDSWSRKQKQVGFKAYMSTMQATIASRNISKLDNKYSIIDSIRYEYNNAFGLDNTSRHLYRIQVKDNSHAIDYFKSLGIVCGVHYTPIHLNDVYSDLQSDHLSAVETAAKQTLSIPMHHRMKTSDVFYVIGCVKKYEGLL